MEQDGQGEGADRAQLAGVVIAGKYWLEEYIGSGSTGAVYRARHNVLEKPIALKVLDPELARSPEIVELFKREAKAASRLDHPNSVRILDFGADPSGLLYIAMEFAQGPDLLQVLEEQFPLGRERVVAIMSQLLGALAQAHELGVVHRDLKPENVLILRGTSDDGQPIDVVKVCDFGVAQLSPAMAPAPTVARSGPAHPTVIDANVLVGTPEYMSPEQARGEPLDARSDVYSAGVVLYQLLTNRVPFTADDVGDVAMLQCYAPPPRPSSLLPVDEALEAICLKAMSKDPEQRYQNAREMRAALKEAAARAQDVALVRAAASLPPPRPSSDTPTERIKPVTRPSATDADTMNPPPAAEIADTPVRVRRPTWALATAAVVIPALGAALYLWPAGSTHEVVARASASRAPSAGPAAVHASGTATAALDADSLAAVHVPVAAPESPAAPQEVAKAKSAREDRRSREDRRGSRARSTDRSAGEDSTQAQTAAASDPVTPALAPELAPAAPPPSTELIATATAAEMSETDSSLAALAESALQAVPKAEPLPPTERESSAAEPELSNASAAGSEIGIPTPPAAPAAPSVAPPAPLHASARIRDITVRGSLATSIVQRAIERIRPQLADCYARSARAAGHNGFGALSVHVELDERGRARSSSASGGTLPGLDRCVSDVASRLTARQAPDTGTVRASWQVTFEPP